MFFEPIASPIPPPNIPKRPHGHTLIPGTTLQYHCCCCCCCCSHINSHSQVRGHRTGSSHSGAEEYPRENTHNPRWCTHISQLTHFMPPPETYKGEIGSQPTMCQVQAGAYVSLLTPGETNYSDCHPRKTTTYILHMVSITTHTHDRRVSQLEKVNKEKKRR